MCDKVSKEELQTLSWQANNGPSQANAGHGKQMLAMASKCWPWQAKSDHGKQMLAMASKRW